jgi:hypothetical protein
LSLGRDSSITKDNQRGRRHKHITHIERETDREGETDRQTERERETERGRERERERGRERGGRERHACMHALNNMCAKVDECGKQQSFVCV